MRYDADPLVWHGPFKRVTLQAIEQTLATINSGPRLPMPLLWIHGDADALVPIEGSRFGIEHLAGPHTTTRTYPGGRHELFNETNSAEVLGDVRGFIEGAPSEHPQGG